MIGREVLEKLEKALERDLEKLFSKGELTPVDWEAVKKAMCIANMIESYKNGESYDEEGSSYGMGMRRSYGRPEEDWGMSGERGRSPVTGRYISRGYSGHSIEDRMIMALEQQMDGASSDYERQMIEKEIKRIRRGE